MKKKLLIGLPIVAVLVVAGLTMATRDSGVEGVAVEVDADRRASGIAADPGQGEHGRPAKVLAQAQGRSAADLLKRFRDELDLGGWVLDRELVELVAICSCRSSPRAR